MNKEHAMESEAADRASIRELIENWALWRDAGIWDRLRTVWHADGRMMATWFQGSADDFIAASRDSFARGVRAQHNLGGMTIELAGNRAVAQTKMAILHRAPVEGVVCDFTCIGRFYDFFEKRGGRWGLVLRQPIYEKDRLDPVDPTARPPALDPGLLMRFPEGYRHLAYLQTQHGYDVKPDMPGIAGPELDALYRRGAVWLAGERV
jgi:SnoaL-like domain